jgi:hypothetical protein
MDFEKLISPYGGFAAIGANVDGYCTQAPLPGRATPHLNKNAAKENDTHESEYGARSVSLVFYAR